MFNCRIALQFSAILLSAFLLAGCSQQYPETAHVSGKVIYKNQPVSKGRICFWPDSGRPAIGELEPDGSYRLTSFESGDGAVPGMYRVTIESLNIHIPENAGVESTETDAGTEEIPTLERLVPEQYERPETTPLTAEVKLGENELNFELREE